MPDARFRIGDLSRRIGVSPESLRAWEARYRVVSPERTAGGLRLYSERDERRLRLMAGHIAEGFPASEAARLAKLRDVPPAAVRRGSVPDGREMLERSFDALDEDLAQAALDRVVGALTLRSVLSEVILPFLHRLGERWSAGQVTVAQEHFASNVIGGRLRSLARGWGSGVGPHAILACAPGEQHDLGLLCFGLALREHGWRITYLGADTPVCDIAVVCVRLAPRIVVLSATEAQRFIESGDAISALAAQGRVGIGGAGASAALARTLGVELLGGEIITAAAALRP